MASRIVPQQQHKGEGRNRRALLDIGNVVLSLKGVEVKPNRPVTRSFCAQLLANAETSLCQWRFDPLLHYSPLQGLVEKLKMIASVLGLIWQCEFIFEHLCTRTHTHFSIILCKLGRDNGKRVRCRTPCLQKVPRLFFEAWTRLSDNSESSLGYNWGESL
ncbi:unnamed protein product [Trifolium pratense]|uniref:Uncharacterized protein n=1 Tax=Trifolium pratense TaxID=57577 RepID=A0ACB0ME32_TRIPR|nr:unnamed protein product [Trifolium pratense]